MTSPGILSSRANPILTLTSLLIAVFMQLIDVSIVNTALPSMAADLGSSFGDLQLVVSVYTLAFACTLITAARLGDLHGRRPVFLSGLTAFTIASILCAAAQTPVQLVIARALQGLTAALMFAQTLAIIQVTFPPRERGRVFGIYGAVIGLATILGPTLGGVLIEWNVFGSTWRSIFLVNVPLGVVALTIGWRNLPDSRDPDATALDLPGALIATLGLGLLVYPLAEGRDRGWPAWLLTMLGCSVPVLVGFVIYQRRRARNRSSPLVNLEVYRDRAFAVGSGMALVFYGSLVSFFFTMSLTLQIGFGYSALRSGLTLLPFAVGSAIGATLSDRLARLLGTRVLMVGTAILVIGVLGVSWVLDAQQADLNLVVLSPILLATGVGLGLYISPQTTVILSGVQPRNAGTASGLLPTMQQLGGSIGLALLGLLFFSLIGGQARDAAQLARPRLEHALGAAGLAVPAIGPAVDRFIDCSDRRLSASDPMATPAGCSPPADSTSAVAVLTHEGETVRSVAFAQSERRTLWGIATVFGIVFLLVPALPRRTAGNERRTEPETVLDG